MIIFVTLHSYFYVLLCLFFCLIYHCINYYCIKKMDGTAYTVMLYNDIHTSLLSDRLLSNSLPSGLLAIISKASSETDLTKNDYVFKIMNLPYVLHT
ncbi:hypothetical protein XELAEV_18015411mg [Xenopus laevis]|uniref:Uncharacterized protein n=1 Tax=Xenopus laevis TaxID=8355 RepID=A0A974DIA7_XENLA|nr:hypothetical protein XELAEV_18015411mg [Xenopus laevis]